MLLISNLSCNNNINIYIVVINVSGEENLCLQLINF